MLWMNRQKRIVICCVFLASVLLATFIYIGTLGQFWLRSREAGRLDEAVLRIAHIPMHESEEESYSRIAKSVSTSRFYLQADPDFAYRFIMCCESRRQSENSASEGFSYTPNRWWMAEMAAMKELAAAQSEQCASVLVRVMEDESFSCDGEIGFVLITSIRECGDSAVAPLRRVKGSAQELASRIIIDLDSR